MDKYKVIFIKIKREIFQLRNIFLNLKKNQKQVNKIELN